MEVKLIVAAGSSAGQKIAVSGPKFFIGRSEECQLRPRSDLVSRHHCAIVVEEGYVGIRDFGSKNGTFVNGERVKAERELKNGDRITVGQLEFEVELVVAVSGKKKPKVHSVQEAAQRMVQSAAEDELDLAGWLAEEETTIGGPAHAETQPLADAAPAAPEANRPAEKKEPEKKEEPERVDPEKEEKKRIDAQSAWHGSKKKPDAADSREAAANMLKNFFQRH
jgi:pSer/pThr/pTyr-binding forkhead associated (FHA) protein